mgnify:CR=1 FL=1
MKIRKLALRHVRADWPQRCIRDWFGCAQRGSQEEEGSGCGAGSAGAAVADVLGSCPMDPSARPRAVRISATSMPATP